MADKPVNLQEVVGILGWGILLLSSAYIGKVHDVKVSQGLFFLSLFVLTYMIAFKVMMRWSLCTKN